MVDNEANYAELVQEFKSGHELIHRYEKLVTVFGSARSQESDRDYELTRQLGAAIHHAGFTVLTGGGPGAMEAASRGAYEAGGKSVGINIQIPQEQRENPFLTEHFTCQHFFSRKYFLMNFSCGYLFAPGGFGTLDELMELLTLIKTEKIPSHPVALLDQQFWNPLLTWLERELTKRGYIDSNHHQLLVVVDSPEAAVQHLLKGQITNI